MEKEGKIEKEERERNPGRGLEAIYDDDCDEMLCQSAVHELKCIRMDYSFLRKTKRERNAREFPSLKPNMNLENKLATQMDGSLNVQRHRM